MSDEAQTSPTLETVLERINDVATMTREFRVAVETRLDAVEKRLGEVEQRLENVEMLVDRVVSTAYEARADVRELRKELRAHLNQFNQPA